jgi:hypothetical protein
VWPKCSSYSELSDGLWRRTSVSNNWRHNRYACMSADPHKQQIPPLRCAPVGMTHYVSRDDRFCP